MRTQQIVVETTSFQPISLFQILRPKQWFKNVYVFAAILFSGEITDGKLLLNTTYSFLIFCAISGSVYVLNDLIDIKKDRQHPKKKLRPLPSGRLPIAIAIIWLLFLLIVTLFMTYSFNRSMFFIVLFYFILNVAYSLYLKHEFLIDAFIVALGFVLRAAGGAVTIHVAFSPWLFVCTTLLSLFLVFGKRRSELIRMGDNATNHRRVLQFYNIRLIDQFISTIVAATIMAYALYSFSATNRHAMMFTLLFVIYGLFRYLYLLNNSDDGDAPEEALLGDFPSVINIFLWGASSWFILYNPLHFMH